MKKFSCLVVVAVAALAVNSALAADPVGTIITQWNFNDGVTTPSTGSGTMSLTSGLTVKTDVSVGDFGGGAYTEKPCAGSGMVENDSSDPASWDNKATWSPLALSRYEVQKFTTSAASGSQWAKWMVSTAGQSNIVVDMDVRMKGYNARYFSLQYTTDNGATWTTGKTVDAQSENPDGLSYGMSTTYIDPATGLPALNSDGNTATNTSLWFNNVTMDLTGVAAVNDNPNFGFRFVPGKGETGETFASYGPCDSKAVLANGKYGFDMVTVTAVPEPSTFVLLGVGAMGLLVLARRRKA